MLVRALSPCLFVLRICQNVTQDRRPSGINDWLLYHHDLDSHGIFVSKTCYCYFSKLFGVCVCVHVSWKLCEDGQIYESCIFFYVIDDTSSGGGAFMI